VSTLVYWHPMFLLTMAGYGSSCRGTTAVIALDLDRKDSSRAVLARLAELELAACTGGAILLLRYPCTTSVCSLAAGGVTAVLGRETRFTSIHCQV
jgi:hypothetical protein